MNYNSKTKQELIDIIKQLDQKNINSSQNQPIFTVLDSKYNLNTLFDDAPLGYFVMDIEGNFIEGNKAAKKIIGYHKEKITGKNFLTLNLLSATQLQKASTTFMKSQMGKSTGPNEFALKHQDGTIKNVEISTFPTLLNNKNVVLGVIQDISARVNLDKELRESELKYRSITQSSIDAIITTSDKRKIIAWNKGAERIFGYQTNEILGKDLTIIIPDMYNKAHKTAFNHNLSDGKSILPAGILEITGLRKNGSLVPIELSVTKSGMGNYSSFTSIIRDISERRSAEIKQIAYTEDLAFLSKSAMQFVELKSNDDVLKIVSKKLLKLIPHSVIVVSSYNSDSTTFTINYVSGLGKFTNTVTSLLGRNPIGMEIPARKGVRSILSNGKLIENNLNITDITSQRVPSNIADLITKTLGIKNHYSIGFMFGDRLLASVNVLLLKDKEITNKSIIDAYLHQSGMALQRQQVMKELEKKSIQQEYLLKTAQQITSSLDLKEVLNEIAHQATTLLDCYGVSLYTLDRSEGMLNPVLAIEPPYEKEILSAPLDINNCLSGKAVKSKKGMIFNDALKDPDAFQVPGTPVDEDEHVLVSPFIVEGRVIGTMTVNRFKEKFTEEDLQLAEAIAAHAATALNNAQSHEKIQYEVSERKNAEMAQKALFQLSEAVNHADSLDDLFKSIHKIVNQLIYARNLYIALYDSDSDLITFPYFADKYDQLRKSRKLDDSITAKVIRSGKPILKSDQKYKKILDPSRTTLYGKRSLDWLGVPLKTAHQTIGALVVQTYSEGERYTNKDLELLNFVSSQIALAIDRKQSEDKFQESIQEILLLEEINRSTQQGHKIDEIIHEVTTLFTEISPIDHICIYLYDADNHKLILKNSKCDSDFFQIVNKINYIADGNFTPHLKPGYRFNQALLSNTGFFTRDTDEIAELLAEFTPNKSNKRKINTLLKGSHLKSLGSVPLHSDGKSFGLIIFSSGQVFVQPDFDRITRIANQVSSVLQRTYERDQLQILSAAVKQSPTSVIITDPIGNIEYVNPKFLEITGYNEKEVIGQNPRFLNSGIQNKRFYQDMWNTILAGKDWHGQFCNKKKNGEQYWESTSISPITGENGDISHFVAVKEDITEQKHAAEELERAEQNLRVHIEKTPLGVIEWNLDFEVTTWNPAAEKIFGYTAKEAIGKHAAGLIVPESARSHVNVVWKSLLKLKGGDRSTNDNITKDGKILTCDWYNTPLIDDNRNVIGVASLVLDITESKKAEESLRDSEERFRTLFEDSLDTIFISDSDGNLHNINRAGRQMFGLNLNDLQKIKTTDFYVNPADRKKFMVENEINGYVKDFQTKLVSKDGRVIDCILNSTVRKKNGDGEIYQGIIRDVSSQVKARKELERALVEAKQADKVKSLFLANMSHEIRTPLNSILGFTDLIHSEIDQFLNKDQRSHFELVQNSGQRLLRTVHEVLDISQIEAGTFKINPEYFELLPVLENIIMEIGGEANSKGIKIVKNTKLRSTFINSDHYCTTQALSNLLNNAVKYTESGSVAITIARQKNQIRLEITDTGIGISEKYMQNIFEPFSQESTGYTKRFQGVGLGLALTKRYLDLNNIKIKFSSKQGVGTTVFLTFPPLSKTTTKIAISSDNSPKPNDTIELPVQKNKILLVEDDSGSRKLVELILKNKLSHVWAETVGTAKRQLKKEAIDLVLLDLSLIGDEDGLDLVRWMRKTKQWKDCPVIALTAHAFTTDRESCLNAGCNDYISKPLNKALFLEKINRLLAG